jgi:hypothetical protein
MNRNNLLYLFLFAIISCSGLNAKTVSCELLQSKASQQDPLKENQILYNGKVWRNLYNNIKGDQFLFSGEYLNGSLTINGKSYKNLSINYDIYNDEIITPTNHSSILQMNKEMVDSFTLVFGAKTYSFKNITEDSLGGIKGYVNVLYTGESALYIKYKKEIQVLAVDDKYDLFYRTYKIYFLKHGIVYQINNKKDLFKLMVEHKTQIKDFIKKNKLKVTSKVPESFVPLLRYYDSISQ